MKKISDLLAEKDYRPGSSNFESYRIDFSRNIIQVRPTGKLLCFYGIFALIGLAIILLPLYAQHDSVDSVFAVIFFGLIFLLVGAGGITLAVRRNYPVIDFNKDIFYPQGSNAGVLLESTPAIPLREIEAINISSRIVRSRKRSYRCFTLSLQCSGQREFILLEHGALKPFMRDARLLAKQLDLPLFDEDIEEKIRSEHAKAAPVLLVFSIFWLGISFFIFSRFRHEQDMLPKLVPGFFIFIGVIMLLSALKTMLLHGKK